jgi:hypothetical protein
MWRRVVLVWTDVSDDRIASIFRVEEAIWASETSVHTKAIWRDIPEVGIHHSHHRENLKSLMLL